MKTLPLGRLPLPVESPEDEVVKRTMELVNELQRHEESDIVDQLITIAAKDMKAVTGIDDTVKVCLQGRIRRLVYSGNSEFDEQSLDAALQRIAEARQAAGKEPETPDRNILDWLVQTTVGFGGAVERLHGEAAERFEREANGVGAVLR